MGPGQWIIAERRGTDPARTRPAQRHHQADAPRPRRAGHRRAAPPTMSWPARRTAQPIIGRLVDRGLDDELRGTAYAVVDGIDGRTHHIKLPDIEAAGDSAPGSIVELRSFEDARGERRVALAIALRSFHRSADHGRAARRGSIASSSPAIPVDLGGGFGLEVKQALEARAEHLNRGRPGAARRTSASSSTET
ncbi:MAG: DUF3363 domain-containing protein [Mesorhizobium sp.]